MSAETVLPKSAWLAKALEHGLAWQQIAALGTRWKLLCAVRR